MSSPVGFALQQKGGAVGNLRDGRVDAEVPYRCGDEVLAGLEQRREVEALVAPVGQVAAGRAVANAMAVDVEDEAVVGADADRVSGGNGASVRVRRKWSTSGSRRGAVGWVIQEAFQFASGAGRAGDWFERAG